MPYGLYVSAAGANAQSTRMQVLSNNLANVDTPGFKRELAVLQARYAAAIQNGEDTPGSGSINQVGGGMSVAETSTDFSPGPLKPTGLETDFAIGGDGFFMIAQGKQELLTRAGNFLMADDGRLTTQQGYSVLSQEGAPLFVQPGVPWRVHANGVLEQAGRRVAIGLVKPNHPSDLARAGENLFRPLAPTVPVNPEQRIVKQGFLEMSGVKPTLAMMELIETSRAYEANIKMIQNHDHVMGALVNRVLRQA